MTDPELVGQFPAAPVRPRGTASASAGVALRGCGTALVTPFTRDGAVDGPALRRLVAWQLAEGVHFLVPCGSTGEAATLTADEHRHVVEIVVDEVGGRVPVVAGAGSNDTQRAIAFSHAMRDAGATHLLHVSPMYSKPPQRGIEAHFRAIADAVDLPIVLYNVPGRTASNMEPATTLRLAQVPNIVAVKEASGNLAQVDAILRDRPAGFVVLSGEDALTLSMIGLGADGVISVVSNATPRAMAQLCDMAATGESDAALDMHRRLTPWMDAAFVESNPIPAKAALAMLGLCEDVLRLPLVPLADAHRDLVRRALDAAGAFAHTPGAAELSHA
ncbi:MAG TPA: 4-hydroxy-tetrahydrodipicolinate synthase [Gemmatirosa sp.]